MAFSELHDIIDECVNKIGLDFPVYFMHENEPKAFQVLTEMTQNSTAKFQKYPLVLLLHPYAYDAKFDYVTCSNVRIAIINYTDENWLSTDRYENNFNPILIPIYNALLKKIERHKKITLKDSFLSHSRTDQLFINGNKLPDKLDGIIIETNSIGIIYEKNC